MAEVIRRIGYNDDGEPMLFILPKINPENHIPTAFFKEGAWLLTPDKNPNFVQFMKWACEDICKRYNLGIITTPKMASIATVIEEGIEDLKAAPHREKPVDLAIRQMREESFKNAVANAEIDGNNVKLKFVVNE